MSDVQERIRATYSKLDALRYTGHLDLQRIWERTLRRSGLPVAFTQGFNPLPKIQLASALPLGIESSCELMDFWLMEVQPLIDILKVLKTVLPPGLEISDLQEVDLRSPALETQLRSAEYHVTFHDPVDRSGLEMKISEVLAVTGLLRERRGRTYDLRPLIEDLHLEPDGALWMKLSLRPGASGRPEEVLDVLGVAWNTVVIRRVKIDFL